MKRNYKANAIINASSQDISNNFCLGNYKFVLGSSSRTEPIVSRQDADLYTVSRCRTRGESEESVDEKFCCNKLQLLLTIIIKEKIKYYFFIKYFEVKVEHQLLGTCPIFRLCPIFRPPDPSSNLRSLKTGTPTSDQGLMEDGADRS